jgi:acetyl esterase/lipase
VNAGRCGAYAGRVAGDDLDAFLSRLSQSARAAGYEPQTHRYGEGPDHEADLMLPATGATGRLAVLLHGGFWRARYKRSIMEALGFDLVQRGWATWNVEYRRVSEGGGVPHTLDDVRLAIEALRTLDAPVDTDRVLVIGHSAGGQLALVSAPAVAVAAVVSLAGVCDLRSGARDRIGDGAVLDFLGGTPEQRPLEYAIADPLARLPADADVLLVHGELDDHVPVQQSRDYASAARAAGGRCELLELAGVEHFALIDPLTRAWAAVAERLDALLPPRSAADDVS